MEETQQLKQIAAYAQEVLEKDASGHSMDHIERVVKMARRLAASEACDHFLVVASAYLHDVIDDKLVSDVAVARLELQAFLLSIGVESGRVQTIFYIIDHVSFSASIGKEPEELTIEAQIVQDADRLDAVGAMGIGRTFYYGGHTGHRIYDPAIPPRQLKNKAEYRVNETVINHFYEKLLLLPDKMHTPLARQIGQERQQVMEVFLATFMKEWQGE